MKTEIADAGNGSGLRLITQDILEAAPKLYSSAHKAPNEVPVVAKFINPCGPGTWYMTEYDPVERRAFGLCVVYEPELGYFNVDDLESIEFDWGLGIQRDPLWKGTLADAERFEHVSR